GAGQRCLPSDPRGRRPRGGGAALRRLGAHCPRSRRRARSRGAARAAAPGRDRSGEHPRGGGRLPRRARAGGRARGRRPLPRHARGRELRDRAPPRRSRGAHPCRRHRPSAARAGRLAPGRVPHRAARRRLHRARLDRVLHLGGHRRRRPRRARGGARRGPRRGLALPSYSALMDPLQGAGRAARDGAEAAERTAETVTEHPVFEGIARGGFVISGLVHMLIGWFALRVALGGSGQDADQSGALRTVAAAPGGNLLLWIGGLAMLALTLWHLAEAYFGARWADDERRRVTHVVKTLGKAGVYGAL